MRWPLRYQILLPMMAVMLCTLLVVTVVNARVAANKAVADIEQQLRNVTRTLRESTFPLTDRVLEQVHGFSGAHYVLTDYSGRVTAASDAELAAAGAPWPTQPAETGRLDSRRPLELGDESYLYFPMEFTRINKPDTKIVLHALYPEESYRAAWQEAVVPPLVIGGAAMAVVAVISIVIASRVAHPIRKLRSQVEHIASGELSTMAQPRRNDEIRDLVISVNRMAGALAEYEAKTRRAEQLRTLGQIGGAIAHQLRNAVTGCRMALDLHKRDCPIGEKDESLEIATRQLTLMEQTIRRLLTGAGAVTEQKQSVDFVAVADKVVGLVEPVARHKGVKLAWERPAEPAQVLGSAEQIEQVIANLLHNAVDAAAALVTEENPVQEVALRVRQSQSQLQLEVADTGPGPSEAVREKLFEPLISDKAGGTGLGLSIVREIVSDHGGQVQWEHSGGWTTFRVSLPLLAAMPKEEGRVETAGRG